MADLPMNELLQAPIEGYGDAIVVPAIVADTFELKTGLLNLVNQNQFYGFERDDPHAHIRWFNKIASTIKYKNVPPEAIKLLLFPFSLEGLMRVGLHNALCFTSQGISRGLQSPPGSVPDRCSIVKWQVPGD